MTLEQFIKNYNDTQIKKGEMNYQEYLKTHEGAVCDYIHGETSLRTLCEKDRAIGFLFDGMGKSDNSFNAFK